MLIGHKGIKITHQSSPVIQGKKGVALFENRLLIFNIGFSHPDLGEFITINTISMKRHRHS